MTKGKPMKVKPQRKNDPEASYQEMATVDPDFLRDLLRNNPMGRGERFQIRSALHSVGELDNRSRQQM